MRGLEENHTGQCKASIERLLADIVKKINPHKLTENWKLTKNEKLIKFEINHQKLEID